MEDNSHEVSNPGQPSEMQAPRTSNRTNFGIPPRRYPLKKNSVIDPESSRKPPNYSDNVSIRSSSTTASSLNRRNQLEAELRSAQRKANLDKEARLLELEEEHDREQAERDRQQADRQAARDKRKMELVLEQELEQKRAALEQFDLDQVNCEVDDLDDSSNFNGETDGNFPLVSMPQSTTDSTAQNHDLPQKRVKTWLCDPNAPMYSQTEAQLLPNPSNAIAEAIASGMTQVIAAMDSRNHTRHIPVRDLPTFSGDPMDWPLFISHYKMTTKASNVSNAENVVRLQKCLKGKAKDAVQFMLLVPDNINEVINTLEMNFGRPGLIVKTLVLKVKEVPFCRSGRPDLVIDLSNAIRNLVCTMDRMKCAGYMNSPDLMEELINKLPDWYKMTWGAHVITLNCEPNLRDLSSWLQKMAQAASTWTTGISQKIDDRPSEKRKDDRPFQKRERVLVSLGEESSNQRNEKRSKPSSQPNSKEKMRKNQNCTFCDNQGHSLPKCKDFAKLHVDERWKHVLSRRICFGCLFQGHQIQNCNKKTKCGIDGCSKNHDELLHPSSLKSDKETEVSLNHTAFPTKLEKSVLLRIAPVTLSGPNGKFSTYALFDEASTVTLLDASVARRIGATGPKVPLRMKWTDSVTRSEDDSRRVSLKITGTDDTEQFQLDNVRTMEKLDLPVQCSNVKHLSRQWKYLEGTPAIALRDAKPTILIGQDNIDLIIAREVIEGPKNAPVVSRTKLGWILHGNVSQFSGRLENEQFTFHSMHEDLDLLHKLVKENWRTEAFGVKVRDVLPRSRDDMRAEALMNEYSVKIRSTDDSPADGDRWMSGLLWRDDNPKLPSSRTSALNRLRGIEKKIDSDPVFGELYYNKIQEYETKGYARKLTAEEASTEGPKTWYLPHFAVTRPNKPGKIRFVFDAAARSNGVSLNDKLLPGPDLLNSLPVVLSKFRQKKIGFTADIKEMFHQVTMRPEDVDSQRFLWRGMDRDRQPDTWVMAVTIFGAVSAPYTAHYIKNRNAKEWESQFPEATDAIVNRHYVDDYLDSSHSETEAIRLIHEVIKIHKSGGFVICNWACSSKEVLKQIPEELRSEEKKDLNLSDDLPMERVLGLVWNPNTDNFTFNCKFTNINEDIVLGKKRPTKREVLRLVMSVFDPLGFLAHYIVKAKILLQDIWRAGLGWDDQLTEELTGKWKLWVTELQGISRIQIPRCYSALNPSPTSTQLHVFCDASEKAFAAVSYWRFKFGEEIRTAFVAAKTRVSPLRPMSIPRLELQAAVMGTRLSAHIKESHDFVIDKIYFWTDSMTVLLWIRSDARKYKPFVAHRVGEIEDESECSSWHWVPTNENVADEATRDNQESEFGPESRWLNGPTFLLLPESSWPMEKTQDGNKKHDLEELELKCEHVHLISIENASLPDISRFSSHSRLVRTTAWVFRFAKICRIKHSEKRRVNTKNIEELTVNEVKNSEKYWWKKLQADCFPDEVNSLKKGIPIPVSSRISTLSPFLDEDGVIRISGRLSRSAQLNVEVRNPVILDPTHPFTRLLLDHYHVQAGHHGQEQVTNDVRQKYWILNIRTAVRSTWNRCQSCKIKHAKPQVPVMGLIPDSRLMTYTRPFTSTGLDYFGPMEVTVGRRREKRYGALFTCLTSRAVHVEVAASLSTDSCIMAIRRFVARRGIPTTIYSDNGTNFCGADNELRRAIHELDQEKIKSEMTSRGIEWKFNPPSAPHMGGSWERLVRSIKTALKSTLREQAPREEVLNTFLAEAEKTVNGRPLTHVSMDHDDPESLTPNHLLLGSSSGELPPGGFSDSDLCLRKQWRIAQRLADHFWKRWIKEYLPTLTRRTKWHKSTKPVQVGDLVVIADSSFERNTWPRGIVTNLYPGKDGVVRVVDVKTASGSTYRRPVAKICVLDLSQGVVNESPRPTTGGGMLPRTMANDVSTINNNC